MASVESCSGSNARFITIYKNRILSFWALVAVEYLVAQFCECYQGYVYFCSPGTRAVLWGPFELSSPQKTLQTLVERMLWKKGLSSIDALFVQLDH